MLQYLKNLLFPHNSVDGNLQYNVLSTKYKAFKGLLAHNTRSLTTLSSLEILLRENKPFTIDHVISYAHSLIGSVAAIVGSLNDLCGGRYQELGAVVSRIGNEVLADLTRPKVFDNTEFVLPLESLCRERLGDIGGKAANYGEIANRVGLPVPRGFAVTAHACQYWLESCGLKLTIDELLNDLDVSDTQRLNQVSVRITSLVMQAELPKDLEQALTEAAGGVGLEARGEVRFSMRSSAASEDSEASFAGQYASVLNVPLGGVAMAYKEVVASTFTPRAIFYRRSKGYTEDDVVMSVLCITMVDARCSGVMYTADPTGQGQDEVIVSAAYGLGVSVVDGSAAVDLYRVDKRDRRIVFREIASKSGRVVMAHPQGLGHDQVPEGLRDVACLGEDELARLVDFGLRLAAHYGQNLDIEWAMDQEGSLFILQARPLNPLVLEQEPQPDAPGDGAGEIPAGSWLLEGGHCASPGVACGLAHVLLSEEQLASVPDNTVLVAPQTSPAFVAIMGRLQGIITDLGSVTGHMAAVAREFELPALVATECATRTIQSGEEITLDAAKRKVYRGRIESLLGQKKKANPMAGSPVYNRAREAMDRIAPLNLTDPHADNFNPKGCQTLHDVIRLAHEISMSEMFQIGEDLDEDEGIAVRLKVPLPMILYCVDLGGGLSSIPGKSAAKFDDVVSVPFQALLRGMTHQNVKWLGAVGMSMGGLVSLMAHSTLYDPTVEGRFGGANYAIISREYMNFNARLGYHFAVVDSHCGPDVDENYITFSFKGGVAPAERRGRRVKLIATILERLGFRVRLQADMVRGELKEGKEEQLAEKLDFIGRLLGSMRLLDMAINSEDEIAWYADEFFRGNYTFAKPESKTPAAVA